MRRPATPALRLAAVVHAPGKPAGARSVDNFAALAGLHRELAERARQAKEAEQRARAAERRALAASERAAREASAFYREVADAIPLAPDGRVEPTRMPPPVVPLQRRRDEEAVLAESLSDEIDVERYLDTGEALSWHRN
ncbi:MAG: DNA mismatch repair protein MutS, partial [Gammaproteobacteria bacterium]